MRTIKCDKCGKTLKRIDSKCDCGGKAVVSMDGCHKDSADPAGPRGEITRDVLRMDYTWGGLNPDSDQEAKDFGLIKPMVKQDDGSLVGKFPVTNVGVFTYRRADGTVSRELRPPSEVFNQDSLASLSTCPMTLDHPVAQGGKVTPDNYQQLATGTLGDRIDTDSYHIYAPMRIFRADAISAAEAGTALGLSMGYKCDTEEKSGNWLGSDYDRIQRNIRYNHCAQVTNPRAGEDAMIRMDGADVTLDNAPTKNSLPSTKGAQAPSTTPTPEKNTMDMKKIRLDGVEYEAEARVIEAYTKEHERADSLNADLEKAKTESKKLVDESQARLDAANEELKATKTKLDSATADLPAQVKAGVESRLKVLEACKAAGVEVKLDSSDADLKVAVIKAKSPEFDPKDRSADYIQARFDSAVESFSHEAAANTSARAVVGETASTATRTDSAASEVRYDGTPGEAEKARERMVSSFGPSHK